MGRVVKPGGGLRFGGGLARLGRPLYSTGRFTIDESAESEASTDRSNDNDVILVKGRVVDPDGKPVSGATVRVTAYLAGDATEETTSDATLWTGDSTSGLAQRPVSRG